MNGEESYNQPDSSILPSLPRNALLLPHTVVIVDNETQVIFEQIEITAQI
jgi:hypothetical protein